MAMDKKENITFFGELSFGLGIIVILVSFSIQFITWKYDPMGTRMALIGLLAMIWGKHLKEKAKNMR